MLNFLERLLEAHREIGSLRAKVAEAQAEAQRARLESLDPARIRKLMRDAIEGPLVHPSCQALSWDYGCGPEGV